MRLKKLFFTKNKIYGMVSLLILSGLLMGARTYIQNWQVVQDSVMEVLNLPTRSSNQLILDQMDLELNAPLRMHAAVGGADSKLYIESNQIEKGDGSLQSTSASDDQINVFAATTVDYQSGATTGGTVEVEGSTFALPACTTGQYRYHVYKYQSASNKLDTKFSTEAATIGALDNVGSVFASIDGTPIGYIILECTASGQYKTAGSATSIVQNKVGSDSRIVRFGSGAGGGAGEVTDFKIQSIATDGTTTIKGGYIETSTGKVLATYDGTGALSTDFGVDLTVDLDNVLSSPTNDTSYYLYVDLTTIDVSATTLTDNGRELYPVEESNLALLTTPPEDLSQKSRYVHIGLARYATAQWSSAIAVTSPIKKATIPSVLATPLEYTMSHTTISSVGTASQIAAGHVLASDSFPSGSDVSWYDLTSVNDGNTTNAHNLTNNGTVTFTSNGILGVSNSAATFNGSSQYLTSSDTHFNPGDTDFTFGGWFKADSWLPASDQNLVAFGNSYQLYISSSNDEVAFFMFDSVSGSVEVSGQDLTSYSGWIHVVVKYVASSNTGYIYSNGLLVGQATLTNGLKTSDSGGLGIAAQDVPSQYFDGDIDEFFFVNGTALSDNEIAKIYASKISHNAGISPNDQDWVISAKNSNIEIPINSYIVDKDTNDLYVDFSGQDSATSVQLKMFDTGASRRTAAINGYKADTTAAGLDASLPITHGLGATPTNVSLMVKVGSSYEFHDPSTYFTVSGSQIIATATTLTSVLGGTTEVILIASVGGDAVATQSEFWNTYRTTSAATLSAGDSILCDTTGEQTLPLNPRMGDTVRVSDYDRDFATNNCTIGRNGKNINGSANNLVLDIDGASVELKYNGVDNWIVLY